MWCIVKNLLAIVMLVATNLSPAAVAADKYRFVCSVDRDSVTVGDRFVMKLELRRPAGDATELIPDLQLPEVFQVIESPPATVVRDGEGEVVANTIELASFRTGTYTIPAPTVLVVGTASDTLELRGTPIRIQVASVLPDNVKGISGIRPPVEVEALMPSWVRWALAVIAALVLLLVVMLLRRRPKAAEPVSPTDWFEEIRRIGRAGLLDSGDFLTYYTSLSETLRRFIEDRTGVEAMERTTDEVGNDLVGAGLQSGRVADIKGFLSEADLVKFSKFTPGSDRAKEDLQRVLDTMGALDADLKPVIDPEDGKEPPS